MHSLNYSLSPIDLKMRHLIRESGMPLRIFSEAIGWKTSKTLDWWSKGEGALNQKNVESLGAFLGVSADSLLDDVLDLSLVRQRIHNGPKALPASYSEHACSYVRTSAHIIEYLSLLNGRHFTDKLLCEMGIHPLFFDDLNNKINLNFFINFFNRLSQSGISDTEIASMAAYISLKIRGSEFCNRLQSNNYHEFYRNLAESCSSAMETNFEYSILGDKNMLQIVARPTEARLFMENMTNAEMERFFSYRHNVFNWFPTLGGLGPLSMKVVKCVLRGDGETVYEADLSRLMDLKRSHIYSI